MAAGLGSGAVGSSPHSGVETLLESAAAAQQNVLIADGWQPAGPQANWTLPYRTTGALALAVRLTGFPPLRAQWRPIVFYNPGPRRATVSERLVLWPTSRWALVDHDTDTGTGPVEPDVDCTHMYHWPEMYSAPLA